MNNQYPKVLVIAIGKINNSDTYNNGLLLRNLFGENFPKGNIAQIYSSGDNGDIGYFENYYQIGSNDRFLGKFFYRFKEKNTNNQDSAALNTKPTNSKIKNITNFINKSIKKILIETGIYEIIFFPKISKELSHWINDFNPDVIFAQGYNLTFTWLPLMIKRHTGKPLAVLTTDDWPKYLYTGALGEPKYFKSLMHSIVKHTSKIFFRSSNTQFAFGHPMSLEYNKRYKKDFIVLNHSDNPNRFNDALPKKINFSEKSKSIVAIGNFNKFRWPLLIDANEACKELATSGYDVKLNIYSSSIEEEGLDIIKRLKHITIHPDPGNDALPSYLKSADVLLLIEGFDEKFASAIELSISSKAHLFMFSKRPIIVYSAENTGVSQYAKSHKWAEVVTTRSSNELAASMKILFSNKLIIEKLVERATDVANKNHTHKNNQSIFLDNLTKIIQK